MIQIRITPTIDNEYANRLPDFLPLEKLQVGLVTVTENEARAILRDAEFNSDPTAVDVGQYGTPIGVFRAYKALAQQVRRALCNRYTPAPWKYEKEKISGPSLADRTTLCAHGHVIGQIYESPGMGNAQSNARIAAAAPELVEAIRAALKEAGSQAGLDDEPGTVNQIARILRKALALAQDC